MTSDGTLGTIVNAGVGLFGLALLFNAIDTVTHEDYSGRKSKKMTNQRRKKSYDENIFDFGDFNF